MINCSFKPVDIFQKEIFDKWLKEFAEECRHSTDIYENKVTDKEWSVIVDLPGVDPKDVELLTASQMLNLEVKKKTKYAFAVPNGYDLNKVDATHKFGRLTIKVPRIANDLKLSSVAIKVE